MRYRENIIKSIGLVMVTCLIVSLVSGCNDKPDGSLSTTIKPVESTTEKPTVDESTTDEATSDMLTTDEATTDKSTVDETTSSEVVTDEQPTDESTTGEPTTDESTTDEPTTQDTTTEQPTTTKPIEPTTQKPTIKDEFIPNLLKPSAGGISVVDDKDKYIYLDYSYASEGYFMVKYTGTSNDTFKVQVIGSNSYQQNYDLGHDGEFDVIPLTNGSDTYTIKIYRMKSSTVGSRIFSHEINVNIKDEDKVFITPSLIVNFDEQSKSTLLSYEICNGLTSHKERVLTIYDYVINNIEYDYDRYDSGIGSRYSDTLVTLTTKKGVCVDYAVLFAAMCRAYNIPTKVVYGYVKLDNGSSGYHAWNEVYYDGSWHFIDTTYKRINKGNYIYTDDDVF